MTLQSTQHKVKLHGLLEVTSEHQEISHDPSLSMILVVLNGMKCITYIYYKIKKLLTNYREIDIIQLLTCFGRHGVLLNSKLNHIDLLSASVNMTLTVQLHSMSTST